MQGVRRGKNGLGKRVIFCVFRQKSFDNRRGGDVLRLNFIRIIKMKNYVSNQSGRSMIEMLGVLAIVRVLSVAGII